MGGPSLGYKIKLRGIGYQFDKGKPLKEYVDVFYDLKKNADNPVDKLISKLGCPFRGAPIS